MTRGPRLLDPSPCLETLCLTLAVAPAPTHLPRPRLVRRLPLCAPVEIGPFGVASAAPLPHVGVVPASACAFGQNKFLDESARGMPYRGKVTLGSAYGRNHNGTEVPHFYARRVFASLDVDRGFLTRQEIGHERREHFKDAASLSSNDRFQGTALLLR